MTIDADEQPIERFKAAVQARAQELELFWKRSLFFWGFIGSAFVGYAAMSDNTGPAAITLTCFGLVCSLAWTLANRGSKYWQENWEQKVAKAEDAVVGELFRKQMPRERKGPFSGYRFSVSRLAIALSDFTVIAWLSLIVLQGFQVYGTSVLAQSTRGYFAAAAMATLVFVAVMVVWTLPESKSEGSFSSTGSAVARNSDASEARSSMNQEAFVRWQGYARDSLAAVNGLFLTYAAALLGLEATILMDQNTTSIANPRWFQVAIWANAASFVLGATVALTRLADARLTARIVRERETGDAETVDELRAGAKTAGKITHLLLRIQVGLFAVAAVSFVGWLYLSFGAKLR